jgi:hypothetical protein
MSPWAGRTSVFCQKKKPRLSPRLIPFMLGPNIHIVSRSDDWIRNPSVLRLEILSECQWEFLRMRLRPGFRTVISIPPSLPETFFICSEIRSKEFEGGNEQNFLCKISAGEILSLSNFKRQVSGFVSLRPEGFGFRNLATEIFSIPIETRTETPPGSCKADTEALSLG